MKEVICLIGSTKYKDEYLNTAKKYELQGYMVLMTHTFSHADGYDDIITEDMEKGLIEISHKRIDLADKVIIVGDHIGISTLEEIYYAFTQNKKIEAENGKLRVELL